MLRLSAPLPPACPHRHGESGDAPRTLGRLNRRIARAVVRSILFKGGSFTPTELGQQRCPLVAQFNSRVRRGARHAPRKIRGSPPPAHLDGHIQIQSNFSKLSRAQIRHRSLDADGRNPMLPAVERGQSRCERSPVDRPRCGIEVDGVGLDWRTESRRPHNLRVPRCRCKPRRQGKRYGIREPAVPTLNAQAPHTQGRGHDFRVVPLRLRSHRSRTKIRLTRIARDEHHHRAWRLLPDGLWNVIRRNGFSGRGDRHQARKPAIGQHQHLAGVIHAQSVTQSCAACATGVHETSSQESGPAPLTWAFATPTLCPCRF